TRTVVQEASSHRLLGTFSGAGNGDYRAELRRALGTVRTYLAEQPLALSRVIVRLDGLYGDGVVVGDVDQQRLGWLMRGRDYGLLDQPPVQARLALPAQQEHTQVDSGLIRQLFDCPQVVLTAQGTRSRVLIARHVPTTASPPVGVLRTTQLAEAVSPETAATVEVSPTMPQVHALEASSPELVGQWARAARPGLFAGKDFTPQEDGTLRCPAGQPLWERERRPQADGRLRIYYAARRGSCRDCGLRSRCLRGESTQVLGRKVSVVVGRTPAPPSPAAAELATPVVVGTQPLLWRDGERRAGRRAWMGWLRSQQVTITRLPSPPPAQSRGSPTLSRAQRAHRRLGWAERLSRNAA